MGVKFSLPGGITNVRIRSGSQGSLLNSGTHEMNQLKIPLDNFLAMLRWKLCAATSGGL